jgi:hypothetical protein
MELLLLPIAFLLLLSPYVLLLVSPGRGLAHMLIVLTVLGSLVLFYKTVKFCFTSSVLRRLNKKQRWVLFFTILIATGMLIYPPWSVREQILPDEAPPVVLLGSLTSGGVTAQQFGPAPVSYGPPKVSYEPMYMGFYSATRRWFQTIAGPPYSLSFNPHGPLGRKPRTADEEFHCKYIHPTRTVELCAGRLGMQLGPLVLLGGLLFWAFTDKGQFARSSPGDEAEETWLVVGPEDLKPKS